MSYKLDAGFYPMSPTMQVLLTTPMETLQVVEEEGKEEETTQRRGGGAAGVGGPVPFVPGSARVVQGEGAVQDASFHTAPGSPESEQDGARGGVSAAAALAGRAAAAVRVVAHGAGQLARNMVQDVQENLDMLMVWMRGIGEQELADTLEVPSESLVTMVVEDRLREALVVGLDEASVDQLHKTMQTYMGELVQVVQEERQGVEQRLRDSQRMAAWATLRGMAEARALSASVQAATARTVHGLGRGVEGAARYAQEGRASPVSFGGGAGSLGGAGILGGLAPRGGAVGSALGGSSAMLVESASGGTSAVSRCLTAMVTAAQGGAFGTDLEASGGAEEAWFRTGRLLAELPDVRCTGAVVAQMITGEENGQPAEGGVDMRESWLRKSRESSSSRAAQDNNVPAAEAAKLIKDFVAPLFTLGRGSPSHVLRGQVVSLLTKWMQVVHALRGPTHYYQGALVRMLGAAGANLVRGGYEKPLLEQLRKEEERLRRDGMIPEGVPRLFEPKLLATGADRLPACAQYVSAGQAERAMLDVYVAQFLLLMVLDAVQFEESTSSAGGVTLGAKWVDRARKKGLVMPFKGVLRGDSSIQETMAALVQIKADEAMWMKGAEEEKWCRALIWPLRVVQGKLALEDRYAAGQENPNGPILLDYQWMLLVQKFMEEEGMTGLASETVEGVLEALIRCAEWKQNQRRVHTALWKLAAEGPQQQQQQHQQHQQHQRLLGAGAGGQESGAGCNHCGGAHYVRECAVMAPAVCVGCRNLRNGWTCKVLRDIQLGLVTRGDKAGIVYAVEQQRAGGRESGDEQRQQRAGGREGGREGGEERGQQRAGGPAGLSQAAMAAVMEAAQARLAAQAAAAQAARGGAAAQPVSVAALEQAQRNITARLGAMAQGGGGQQQQQQGGGVQQQGGGARQQQGGASGGSAPRQVTFGKYGTSRGGIGNANGR